MPRHELLHRLIEQVHLRLQEGLHLVLEHLLRVLHERKHELARIHGATCLGDGNGRGRGPWLLPFVRRLLGCSATSIDVHLVHVGRLIWRCGNVRDECVTRMNAFRHGHVILAAIGSRDRHYVADSDAVGARHFHG